MPDAPEDEMRTCNCFAVESDPTCNGHLPTCNMHWPSGYSGALPATDTPAETRRCGAAIHPTLGRCVRVDFHDGDHLASNGETWREPVFRPILHRIIDMETEIARLRHALQRIAGEFGGCHFSEQGHELSASDNCDCVWCITQIALSVPVQGEP